MPAVQGDTIDEAHLADVCTRYGIARLRVFGSVARRTATPYSDIDVRTSGG
jgi:predicted nucleotidyltransferase